MLGEVLTAIVTPFREDGSVDFHSFAMLAHHLVENGSDGIVVAGTTGESPTLSEDERLELFRVAVGAVGDQATVIAGTGTYSTAESVHLTEQAHNIGVGGFLVVTPYYNKPPQRGIVERFLAELESGTLVCGHTSGLTYGIFGNSPVDQMYRKADIFNAKSLEAMVKAIAGLPLLHQPGEFWEYSVSTDVLGREAILRVHTKKIPLGDNVELSVLARGTPGLAGADLANLVNEAALVAARQNRKVVTQFDFELAKDKVMMGVERKSLIISDEEKKNTAYHEAGHALVATQIPFADPLHKVTIIPRGMALGLTMQLPLDDKHSYHKEYLAAQLAILMGGRIAEEIMLGEITTGAGNDLERATEMAR
jgi:hypothetical protein